MKKAVLQSNIQSSDGGLAVAAGATVTIRDSDTLALATLYTDRNGGTTTANPVTADADGFFRVYVNPERRYNITATLGAETQSFNDIVALDEPGFVQVDTIADLRGLTVTNDLAIYLKAHTSANDGGGGVFIGITGASIATYTDDDGVVVLPTGGDGSAAWIRVFNGAIDAEWYGATGDGVTDDTAAIQAAIDYADSAGGGTVILNKAGSGYVFSAKLTIPSNLKFMGKSPAEFTVSGANPSSIVLIPTAVPTIGIEMLNTTSSALENIAIDCTNAGATFTGVLIDGVQHSTFKNVSCVEMSLAGHTGFEIRETSRGNYWNNAENCKARGFPADLGKGFYLQGNTGIGERVNQWTFINCSAFDMGNGWQLDEVGAGITLINCTGEQCSGDGILITDTTYAGVPNIIGGEFSNNAGYGVNGKCTLINTAISGNTSGPVTNGGQRQFFDDTSGNYLHMQFGLNAWDYSKRKLEKTITAASQTIETNLYGIIDVVGDAPYTMTSTPTLQAGTRDGQMITITARFPGANTITLQDNATLAGSGLFLKGGGTLTLSSLQSVDFYWRASESRWYECGRN